MKNMSKKIIFALVLVLMLCACAKNSPSVVGRWRDETTGRVVEYTADGLYYEFINENFTTDKTNYRVKNGKIEYYIPDAPESEYEVEYEVKDGKLIIEGTIEYIPYEPIFDFESEETE